LLGREAIDSDIWAHGGIVLTTFETMRGYHLSFARQRFAAIIYDETQKLKNPASQMTRSTDVQSGGCSDVPVHNRLASNDPRPIEVTQLQYMERGY